MSQIDQNTQEIDKDTDQDVNLLDYEEIESEIITFEVTKAHDKVKMFPKYHEKLIEALTQQEKVEIQNLFSDNSTIKFGQDIEFQLNYDTHAGTILYFQEKEENIEMENVSKKIQTYEYVGPSTRKIFFGVDPNDSKLHDLLDISAVEAKKGLQEDVEFQRLDSIYNIKDKKNSQNEDQEDENQEIFLEEEKNDKNGDLLFDFNYGKLTKEDLQDMMLQKQLNQRTKSGRRSSLKAQPNLIRKKVIAEILSQKKAENLM